MKPKSKLTVIIITISILIMTVQAASAAPEITISVLEPNHTPGDSFTVGIFIHPIDTPVMGAEYKLSFNNSVLKVLNQTQGIFLSPVRDNTKTINIVNNIYNPEGRTEYGEMRIDTTTGVTMSGPLAEIEFKARCSGISELKLYDVVLSNPDSTEITDVTIENAVVNVSSKLCWPFIISGNITNEDGSDCTNPTVTITNLNISKQWTAQTLENSNHYRLILKNCDNIVKNEIIQINAVSPDGTQSKLKDVVVIDTDMCNGGFIEDIQLEESAADITPPVISNVANSTPTGSAVTITWDTDEASTSMVKYGNAAGTYSDNVSDAAMASAHSISLSGLSPDTTYYFVVSSTDASSNSNESEEFSFTTTSTADITPPVISNVANSTPTGSAVTITWDTDEASTSMVKYGNATGTYTDNVSDAAMASAHSISLSGLSPDTTYYFVVSSTDASSNSNESEELSFTTTSTADITPPKVTDNSPTGTDVAVSTDIAITFDEAMNQSSAEAAFSINPEVNGTITWSANTMSFDPGLDLLEETTYTVTISTQAEDTAGNALETPFTWDFTTKTEGPSTTTVSIGDISIEPGESTIVPIMVNNVENLSGCRINLTYDSSVVHVTGITKGDMNLLAYNINNGTGWMTANALDESGLDGDVTFVNIEFTAVGGKGNSTILDMTVLELFADDFTSIEHTVEVGSFTIEADNEAPVVTDATGDRDEILNDNGRPRASGTNITTLNVTVTDADSGVANVVIDLSSIGGSADQSMDQIEGTDIWTVTTNAIDGVNLTHQLTITATDNEGNINNSVSITLTVLRRGDVYRDNVIDNKDVLYIARYLANLEPEYSNQPTVLIGDVVGMSGVPQGDGTVDLMDALYIAKYLANLEGEP